MKELSFLESMKGSQSEQLIKSIQFRKAWLVVLVIQTWVRRMEGTNESTWLWRPSQFVLVFNFTFISPTFNSKNILALRFNHYLRQSAQS